MTWLALGLSAVFLVANFVVRAAGASLIRTRREDAMRDAASGDERARIVADLLEDRAAIQPALNPVSAGLVLLAVIPATWAISRLFSGWLLALVLLLMVALLVLVTDIVPRTIGRNMPRRLAYRFASVLRVAARVGAAANDLVSEVEEGEPEIMAPDSADAAEQELITQVLDFRDTIVREVMVPRTDMVTVAGTASTDDALDVILQEGRSRIPVTGEGIDDIVGILYARDLLVLYDQEAPARPSAELARPPFFVPESKQVSDLLREMQASQLHLAIVVDEFGGTAGLVTIEDLLEELVGEIADEYDTEEPMAIEVEEGVLLVDARMDVDEFAGLVSVEVPAEEYDTVGGLVLGLAGRVPREGESFEYDGLTLTAARVQGRRVSRVRVRRR